MVTGVRGTSVDVIKDKITAVYTMTITDSVSTSNTLKTDNTATVLVLKDYIGHNVVTNTSF
jgi:putative transposon-encoded protein